MRKFMDLRIRLLMVLGVALLAALPWTLPQWWALANPESPIAAGLPELELEARALFDALPDEEQAAYFLLYEGDEDLELMPNPDWALALVRARLLGNDSSAPEAIEPFEAPEGASDIAIGTWLEIDLIRRAEGDITIYQLSDGSRLLRFDENFASTRAPDVHLILSRNPDPMDERGVGVDYIDIGSLKGNIGAQNYVVPASADFSRYPVMVLYSVQYGELIATLTIRR
jgi:hypothetical protein